VRRELGLATLLVTHDLREAFSLADRIAVMRAGRIEQVDTPDALLRSPESEYVAQLLDTAGVA
jgi:putative spermidine/putrescine transport system ATP-binding protein